MNALICAASLDEQASVAVEVAVLVAVVVVAVEVVVVVSGAVAGLAWWVASRMET